MPALTDIPLASLLETVMLLCFGFSWPVSIAKTLRTKTVKGKSVWFLLLIVLGYAAGVLMKFIVAADTGQPVDKVAYLYALNGLMVSADIGLYLRFRQRA